MAKAAGHRRPTKATGWQQQGPELETVPAHLFLKQQIGKIRRGWHGIMVDSVFWFLYLECPEEWRA